MFKNHVHSPVLDNTNILVLGIHRPHIWLDVWESLVEQCVVFGAWTQHAFDLWKSYAFAARRRHRPSFPPPHHSILITAARPRPYSRTSSWTLNSADVRHEAGTRRAPGALRLCVALPLRAADLLLQSSRSEPRDHGPAGQNAHLPPHGEHFDVYPVFGCCHWPFRLHVVMGMFWCVAEIVRWNSTYDLPRRACKWDFWNMGETYHIFSLLPLSCTIFLLLRLFRTRASRPSCGTSSMWCWTIPSSSAGSVPGWWSSSGKPRPCTE